MKKNPNQQSNKGAPARRGKERALWTVQGLLALVFLFTGGMKLVTPVDVMLKQMPLALPGVFVKFLGLAEVLGAFGMILPGLFRIRRELTPLAACGLATIMGGATVYTVAGGCGATALAPAVIGLLAAFVANGRWSSFSISQSWSTLQIARSDACSAVVLD